jgi:hypothetical protein
MIFAVKIAVNKGVCKLGAQACYIYYKTGVKLTRFLKMVRKGVDHL